MQYLCIGVDESADDIIQHINDELKKVKNKINYSVKEVNSDNSTSIICSIGEDKPDNEKSSQAYNILMLHVSSALADFIIRRYEEKLITRIINTNYCYFNSVERREILGISLKIIRNEDKNFLNSLFQIRRRNIIIRKLMEYFENSNSLILDGFVNFRLKDYIKDLEEIVEKAVDEFLMEREYREFIRLLKYFVEIQDPKAEIIHVIVGYDNRYILQDEKRNEITNECIREFVNEISEGEINYDDLLVSSLITMAPKKIVIHSSGLFKNKELLETIKNVFPGRVVICNGCEACMASVSKSEDKKQL
ncbi:sporulation protein [Clostridium thermosuccinogenes]|uniref:Sporulation protein n=1 Tax=Clostridium thermosuccinogenes TaxID=84032 RepID=A0A2K2FDB7_9CLOT|nr:putative sporulation protein YtxC [Pseudoclostridium thermosuccinogenes]AUS95224.1 sporulation protein [Pseudoclostridium thermosuccinogenes]PNT96782.1 sporulation protein [Pseudoclostridium thermosuccinogenes]PNT98619.1 sporulation protein [Pseudoclostridium thermosuccinogenes]